MTQRTDIPLKKQTWIRCQINYVERRFGRKLTPKEKALLIEELKKKYL